MVPLEALEITEPRDKTVNLEKQVLKVPLEKAEKRASLEMPDRMESQESLVKKDVMGFPESPDRRVALEKRV